MVSPFQGTPNIPLQLDSMTNECTPSLRASGGMIYSTLRSPPYPPVIPVSRGLEIVQWSTKNNYRPWSGMPSMLNIIASHPGSNSTLYSSVSNADRGSLTGMTYIERVHIAPNNLGLLQSPSTSDSSRCRVLAKPLNRLYCVSPAACTTRN